MYQYDKELASAFQVDCEEFLNEFEKFQSFNFTDFQEIWHQKSFSFIFSGQIYALLLKDFCENCFYVVKKYIMFPRTMFTQIGAFYLLYGLYYRQPVRRWIQIRITFEEYHKLYELILEMKDRNQWDAVYIFSKMTADSAFLYVCQRKPLGPEDRFVKGVELYINDTFTSSKTQSSLIKFQELHKTADLFKNFEDINSEYNEKMKKFAEKSPLTPFSSNLMEEIQKSFVEFNKTAQSSNEENTQTTNLGNSQSENEDTKESTSIYASRNAIKQRALENKNATYRANRKVITAVDEDTSENSSEFTESDD